MTACYTDKVPSDTRKANPNNMKKFPIRSSRLSTTPKGVILEVRLKAQGGPIHRLRFINRQRAINCLRRNYYLVPVEQA